jgi:hypothetical protein
VVCGRRRSGCVVGGGGRWCGWWCDRATATAVAASAAPRCPAPAPGPARVAPPRQAAAAPQPRTWPAWGMVTSELSGIPGSAGTAFCTVCVSTATTPTGMPPRRARPVTTVRAQLRGGRGRGAVSRPRCAALGPRGCCAPGRARVEGPRALQMHRAAEPGAAHPACASVQLPRSNSPPSKAASASEAPPPAAGAAGTLRPAGRRRQGRQRISRGLRRLGQQRLGQQHLAARPGSTACSARGRAAAAHPRWPRAGPAWRPAAARTPRGGPPGRMRPAAAGYRPAARACSSASAAARPRPPGRPAGRWGWAVGGGRWGWLWWWLQQGGGESRRPLVGCTGSD